MNESVLEFGDDVIWIVNVGDGIETSADDIIAGAGTVGDDDVGDGVGGDGDDDDDVILAAVSGIAVPIKGADVVDKDVVGIGVVVVVGTDVMILAAGSGVGVTVVDNNVVGDEVIGLIVGDDVIITAAAAAAGIGVVWPAAVPDRGRRVVGAGVVVGIGVNDPIRAHNRPLQA